MKGIAYVTLKNGQCSSDLIDRLKMEPPSRTEREKELFRKKLFAAQAAVEDALKDLWGEGSSFEVGWDFDYSYSLHGGIYSDKIFCPAYAVTVALALCSVEDSDRWVYHTVCEIEVNPNGRTPAESIEDRGQFYITNSAVYFYEDEMKLEFRKRLGAND